MIQGSLSVLHFSSLQTYRQSWEKEYEDVKDKLEISMASLLEPQLVSSENTANHFLMIS